MTPPLSSAESVFSFIDSTAEPVGDGYRWQTYDYADEPHHHYCVFNGVGGIPIFLCAYFQATSNPRALELARGALVWSFAHAPERGSHQRGLSFGKLGLAYPACCYAKVSGSDAFSVETEALVDHLLVEPPGPITDILSGEASNGWVLWQLWCKDPQTKYLEGALRCARWLEEQLVRDERGTHCVIDPVNYSVGKVPRLGLSHGIPGVAHFFACLYRATADTRWQGLAMELLDTLTRHARPDRGGINWPRAMGADELPRCQYSIGAAGVGLVLVLAAQLLEAPVYLATALQAGEATYRHGDRRENPTLCTGLAGGGELMIELYRSTRDERWLTRAREFAAKALAYRAIIDGQHFWPTDTAGCFSADFVYGAAGTGYFFLRAAQPLEFEPPLL